MWLFKRKKKNLEFRSGPPCLYCRSTHTKVITIHGSGRPDPVKTWRGQRYWTCRCYDCGRDFYAEEPPEGLDIEAMPDDGSVDNEEELQAAEDELKRRIEEDDDRRCR
jgi:hypothetical protein